MEKITLETIENSYKEAIRNKYKIEKVEGKNSHYLNNPSQALLRDLCWEIFSTNPKSDDLNVYRNFFRSEFKSEEDTSIKYTDKFRKVGRFYKGDIKPANITTVELAAILVDFQPRPFNKFRKKIDDEDLEIYNELKNTIKPSAETSIDGFIDEVENREFIDSETIIDDKELEQIQSEEKESTSDSSGNQKTNEENEEEGAEEIKTKNPKHPILRYLAISAVLAGLALIIYLALPQKECMQWSNDHYELVDCDLKIQGLGMANHIELLDKSLINLKKVNVCDTTSCFDKNGEAIIWYAKTANGIDFFNGHGRHPENNKALKPITQYIIDKYVKK